MTDKKLDISQKTLHKYGTRSQLLFVFDMICKNRKKLSFKKIFVLIKRYVEKK